MVAWISAHSMQNYNVGVVQGSSFYVQILLIYISEILSK